MRSIIINEKNIGLPPGTPIYVGDRPAATMDISLITFDPLFAEMKNVSAIDDLPLHKNDGIIWININGLKDIDSIKKLANMYDIHPLTIEDVLNTEQQPKVETFENYRFISLKSIKRELEFHHIPKKRKRFFVLEETVGEQTEKIEEIIIDQISIIIMKNVLITFQEISGDPFGGIRKRILENAGQIRTMGTDYLTYSLIDAVVDNYYLTLAHLEDDIEDFEDRAVKTSDDTFIAEIQDTKKYLFQIKRAMMPLRDNLVITSRKNMLLTNDELQPFLQDLRENLTHAIETVENYRDWLSIIMEVNLSVLSYQLNKVMKILAIVSAIFIPLTFIAGIYGMNFENMPELSQPWAYPIVLGGMGLIALTMLIFFKIRHWF